MAYDELSKVELAEKFRAVGEVIVAETERQKRQSVETPWTDRDQRDLSALKDEYESMRDYIVSKYLNEEVENDTTEEGCGKTPNWRVPNNTLEVRKEHLIALKSFSGAEGSLDEVRLELEAFVFKIKLLTSSYSEEYRFKLAMLKLEGTALWFVVSLSEKILSFASLVAALNERFGCILSRAILAQQFHSLSQLKHESAFAFADRVRDMARRAFQQDREAFQVAQFLRGLEDKDLAKRVTLLDPQSLTAALYQLTRLAALVPSSLGEAKVFHATELREHGDQLERPVAMQKFKNRRCYACGIYGHERSSCVVRR